MYVSSSFQRFLTLGLPSTRNYQKLEVQVTLLTWTVSSFDEKLKNHIPNTLNISCLFIVWAHKNFGVFACYQFPKCSVLVKPSPHQKTSCIKRNVEGTLLLSWSSFGNLLNIKKYHSLLQTACVVKTKSIFVARTGQKHLSNLHTFLWSNKSTD